MHKVIEELVNKHGYEFGDLIENPIELPKFEKIWNNSWNYDYGSEPYWNSLEQRNKDYETVTEMLLGIPSVENNSVDTGALNWMY